MTREIQIAFGPAPRDKRITVVAEVIGEWGIHPCLCGYKIGDCDRFQITHVATGIKPPRCRDLEHSQAEALAEKLTGWTFTDYAGFMAMRETLRPQLAKALQEIGRL